MYFVVKGALVVFGVFVLKHCYFLLQTNQGNNYQQPLKYLY